MFFDYLKIWLVPTLLELVTDKREKKDPAPYNVVLSGENKIILHLTFIDKIENLSKSPFLPIIRAILFLFYAWF